MNKQEKAIKVRRSLTKNHNQSALKVRKAIVPNHNQVVLKVCKGIRSNHNETALEIVLSRAMSDAEFAEQLTINPEDALAGYDLTTEEVQQIKGMSRVEFQTMAAEERRSFGVIVHERTGTEFGNHNQSALKVSKSLTGNHSQGALKVRKALTDNHSQSALKVRKTLTDNHSQSALKVRKTITTLFILVLMFAQLGAVDLVQAAQCTPENGQSLIDEGKYKQAVIEFTCVVDAAPTEVEGYRGRIEAELLLGQYSDAVRDYARVTALVQPVHPDAQSIILAGYADRLVSDPDSVPALTGESFALWWYFSYSQAIHTINHLLEVQPNNIYGNLFRGSSRLLSGSAKAKGVEDLENAIMLDPNNPHVRYIVADAYTYGIPDSQRAFSEASFALQNGLDTPRVHAIIAASYNALGNTLPAAEHIKTHIDLVTTDFASTAPLTAGTTFHLDLVPGRTYDIPVSAVAGETLSITTSSKDYWDTIFVLIAPDGTPVIGSDDTNFYFAAINWTVPATGTYHLQVTFFESVIYGDLVVARN